MYAVEFFDWNYDTLSTIGKIQDPILVTNHQDDQVIPESSSLSMALTDSGRSNIQVETTDRSFQPSLLTTVAFSFILEILSLHLSMGKNKPDHPPLLKRISNYRVVTI